MVVSTLFKMWLVKTLVNGVFATRTDVTEVDWPNCLWRCSVWLPCVLPSKTISITMTLKTWFILSIEINELCWSFRIYFAFFIQIENPWDIQKASLEFSILTIFVQMRLLIDFQTMYLHYRAYHQVVARICLVINTRVNKVCIIMYSTGYFPVFHVCSIFIREKWRQSFFSMSFAATCAL